MTGDDSATIYEDYVRINLEEQAAANQRRWRKN